MPAAISSPGDLRKPSVSERRTTASTAATNGCRLAARVARAGPIRWRDTEPEDVRQDERAERGEDEQPQISHPTSQSCDVVTGRPTSAISTQGASDHDGADVRRRVGLHERGDGDRVGGPRRRSHEPEQDAAVASRDVPAEPIATSDTPTDEIAAPPRSARLRRSPEGDPEERGEDRDRADQAGRSSTRSSRRARRRSTPG